MNDLKRNSNADLNELSEKTCSACRVGAPQVTEAELAKALEKLPEWSVIEIDAVKQLTRVFKFKSFAHAMVFTNEVAVVAEDFNHHPSLLTEWGKVTVNWWTHKVKGLHENDLILAAKTEKLFHAFNQT